MKFLSRLGSAKLAGGSLNAVPENAGEQYESVIRIRSKVIPAVTFSINRISFGRRMELSRRAREISKSAEFLEASGLLQDKIDASILAQEVDAMYVRWGLNSISALTIDGEPATTDRLLDKGPDELTKEIVVAIKQQCGLNDAERKN